MSPVARTVAFRTLGCKVNRVESDTITAELLGDGWTLVPESDAAVVVINTCTVTGEADAKARKAVRQALKAAGEPIVVVTGCLAAIDAPALRRLGERVVVEVDKEAVSARVAALVGAGSQPEVASVAPPRAGEHFRARAAVKIEDGCDNRCAYCIVPRARGVPRAVPLSRIVDEATALVEAGIREIVLTGVNLGRYRDGTRDLADVISAVGATGVPRVRISSIEPPDLDERLLAVLSETPSVCAHLHVPLQSGSDAVLEAMGRSYTVAEYLRRIEAAREALPSLAVTTDVIAGLPGESESDHEATLDVIARVGFSKLHVFRYSQRAGTPAAVMAQVPATVRARRASELRAAGEQLQERFAAERIGSRAELLVERVDSVSAEGTTREYLRLNVPAGHLQVGDLVPVTVQTGNLAHRKPA